MEKGEEDYIEPGSEDIGENTLDMETDKSPESDFFLSAQKGKKVIRQKKGKMKIDKSTRFFLGDQSMPDGDSG
ncbi:MAG: hypothetical protein IMF10_07925 [Proteobacteria bacterium]|nr:hypothetical protein [Pseudomonadota bacterium]